MSDRILIVDDEPALLKGLRYSLEQDGYVVETAEDGETAYDMALNGNFELVVLDLMLPKMDGLEVCRKLRETSMVPILILTANGEDSSKLQGLENGADDYLTKPFNVLELKARIRAILRRVNIGDRSASTNTLKIDDFSINTLGRKVNLNNQDLSLTAKEFDLLLLLAANKGKVYTREELLEVIWGYEYFGDVRTVDVHIRRLREKIEKNSSQPEYIMTKWGVGYYFRG